MVQERRLFPTFTRGTTIFLLVCALDAFGYFGIQAVLLNLYLLRLGFGAQFIGLLIAAGQLLWAVAAFPAEALGRRLGVRPALILGSVLAALGMSVVLLVESLPRAAWVPGLFGGWALLWVGTALYSVHSPPYVMQVAQANTRHQAFAAQGVVLAFMGFAGSFVAGVLPGLALAWTGGSLADPAPYRIALWAAPISYLLCALLWLGAPAVRAVPPPARSEAAKPLGLFGFLVLLVFLQTASEGALLSFGNVYLDTQLGVPAAHIGTILGLGQLIAVGGVLAVPRLVGRWGAIATLSCTTLGVGAALVPLALISQQLPATLACMCIIALSAMNGPMRTILSQELVRPHWRATTSALLTIGLAAGWASTAALGGFLIARAGFGPLFAISAGCAFAAVGLLWGYRRRR